jgi:putative membrane protein
MVKLRWLATMTLLAAASTNCSSKGPDESSAPAASQGGEATPAEAAGPTPEHVATTPPAALNDAEIAKITDTVDSAEIEQANVASSRASHASVKQFAEHMIAQHTASKQKGADLVHKKGVTPVASTVSGNLQRDTMQMIEKLKAADTTSFDATYIAGQIEEHQQVLQLLNSQLIPSATDADLKSLLIDARAMVEQHIAEAKSIQQSLSSQ